MASLKKKNVIYDDCDAVKRIIPAYQVDESILKEIGSNFRTLPTFEKSLYEQVFIRNYSLERNEMLRCRWNKYIANLGSRVFAPFRFPDVKDLHMGRGGIEYLPAENRYKFDNRLKLRPGPGVDAAGQLPIPQEHLMKRSGNLKVTKQPAKNKQLKKVVKK